MIKFHWSYIPLLASFIAIGGALTLQYGFNIAPCQLCYEQRYLWMATGFFALWARCFHGKIFIILTFFLLMASMVMGIYQTGTIYGLWLEATSCQAGGFSQDTAAMIGNLGHMDLNNLEFTPSCNSADQKIFGLPIPLLNSLLALMTLILSFFSIKYMSK